MLNINNILSRNVIGSIFVAIFLLIMGGGLTSCGFGGEQPAGENRGVTQPGERNENEEDEENENRNQNEDNEEEEDEDDD